MADGNGVQHWGADGESERFDDLREAHGFAKTLWEDSGRHHAVVIKDKEHDDQIVKTFEAEPHDTIPEPSADDTRRLPSAPKN